jgi:site-specific DNA-cytosine methylase
LPIDFNVASDRKRTARSFTASQHSYRHIIGSATEHAEGICTSCDLHVGERCKLSAPDVVVSGLPCHPFTKLRNKTPGGSGRTGLTHEHPDMDTIFEEFRTYLLRAQPLLLLLEETDAVVAKVAAGCDERWVDVMLTMLSQCGYSCNAMMLDSKTFIDWPRRRLRHPSHIAFPLPHRFTNLHRAGIACNCNGCLCHGSLSRGGVLSSKVMTT